MSTRYNYRNITWLFLSLLVFLLDFSSKYWIRTNFILGEVVAVLPGLNYCYVCNTGLVFGVLSDYVLCYRWFVVCLVMLSIIILLDMLCASNERAKYHCFAYSVIIGGAFGNVIDRIFDGSVVDFVDVYINDWHWPIFNVADMVICLGIGVLTLMFFCNNSK